MMPRVVGSSAAAEGDDGSSCVIVLVVFWIFGNVLLFQFCFFLANFDSYVMSMWEYVNYWSFGNWGNQVVCAYKAEDLLDFIVLN